MVRFAFVALCVTAAIAGTHASGPTEYGANMLAKAHAAVCWYEYLRNFPQTDSEHYGKCGRSVAKTVKFHTDPNGPNAQAFRDFPNMLQDMIKNELINSHMEEIPAEYTQQCKKYLESPEDAPPSDESDALGDTNGTGYPFKAASYCLMQTLRNRHGDEAVQAVKRERVQKAADWRQALLNRENAFRALHGAKPLKLIPELSDAATAQAQDNARKCKMEHSDNEDAGRQWHGQTTGENLAVAGGWQDELSTAYIAADGWYEENKDYPWPAYQGGNPKLFKKIGHFTQSIWDESEYVGYGYAFNEKCTKEENYIAARYSPPGNRQGKYGEHVKPKLQ